jgi:hypothetical protein
MRRPRTPEERKRDRESRRRLHERFPEKKAAHRSMLREMRTKGYKPRKRKTARTDEQRARRKERERERLADPAYRAMKLELRKARRERLRLASGYVPRRPMSEEERHRRKKLDKQRSAARDEARRTGADVYELFERWDCLLPCDAKHMTPEAKLIRVLEGVAAKARARRADADLECAEAAP